MQAKQNTDLSSLFARLVNLYNQTVELCNDKPTEVVKIEEKCKGTMVNMILETMDKEARW